MSFVRWLCSLAFVVLFGIGGSACSDSVVPVGGDDDDDQQVDPPKPDAGPKPDASLPPDAAAEPTPVSLGLTPPALSLAAGTRATVQAVVTLSDRSTRNVTDELTWTSSDAAIATATGGEVQALAPGSANLEAKVGALTTRLQVTVTAATLVTLAVTPTTPSLAKGLTLPLIATGTFSDQSTQDLTTQVAWTSSAPEIATVDTAGLLTAAAVGVTEIGASFAGVSATTSVAVTAAELVSLALTPPAPTVPRGFTRQLVATGTFTDASTQDVSDQVSWSSADDSRATVTASGLVTANNQGAVVISATRGDVVGSTTVTVTDAELVSIEVSPATQDVPRGLTAQLTATGVYSDATVQDLTEQVTWGSSAEATVAVSNAAGSRGLVTAREIGSSEITAAVGAIVSPVATMTVTPAVLVSLAVTPATTEIAAGYTQQLVATGTYSDGTERTLTDTVTWSSSDPAVAAISNAVGSQGLATALAEGAILVQAAVGPIVGTAELEVTAAELIALAVTPNAPSIAKGRTQQLVATGTFSDATQQDLTDTVTWSSSSAAIASVSNADGTRGLATSVSVGDTTISATLGAVSASTLLTVTPAVLVSIAITPDAATVARGSVRALTATGTYSDATTLDVTATVTWASSVAATATVSNAAATRGQATAIAVGVTEVTATLGAIVGSTELTVDSCYVTINELSTAGANGAGDEYVELYNACAFAIDLKDWKLHYRSAAGTSDSSLVTFGVSTVLVPGAFRVYAGSQFVGVSQGSLASALAAAGGGIGLRDITGTVRDSVGFGTATNVFVEGTVAAAPPSGQSIGRFPADGKDTNNNAADFHVATRTPGAPNL